MGMAERIKERRKAMGYTQTELGEKLGLQASEIGRASCREREYEAV